jgi:hypothetical protein
MDELVAVSNRLKGEIIKKISPLVTNLEEMPARL